MINGEVPHLNAIVKKPSLQFGIRHTQYLFMFFAILISYGMRTILNVAVVAMIPDSHDPNTTYSTYPEWKEKKNIILSSFFWGYVGLQIFAGQVARKVGSKLCLAYSLLTASLFTILIPVFGDEYGYVGIIICRIILGASQGCLIPCIHTLLSQWAPVSERAQFGGMVYSGQPFGNVVSMPIAGALSSTKIGWPLVFYLYGFLGIVWSLLWIIFGSNSPLEHKAISLVERKWIVSEHAISKDQKISTPWFSIFTSVPFLALMVTHCGHNWGYWTLLTEIPTYMHNILGFDIASNSILSALPYFVCAIMNIVMNAMAHYLVEKKIVSLTVSRKIFNSIGFVIPAAALLTLSFLGTGNTFVAVITLVTAVGFNAGIYSGFYLNHIDISPTYAGTLISITNTAATTFSIFAPLTIDFVKDITKYEETQEELWNIVFRIAAGFYIAVALVFDIFSSSKIQSWNDPNT